MKENQNGILHHINGCGRDTDPLASEMNDKNEFWSSPELECCMVVDNFTNANENEVRDSVAPNTIPSEFFDKVTDLYTDKSVMECELPELIVCYKDSSYHVVKDICIDEGVPSEDKILIENGKDDHKDLCTSLPSDGDKHSDTTKGGADAEFLVQDALKSSSGKYCDKDTGNECQTKEKGEIVLLITDGMKSSSEDEIDRDAAYECGSDGLKSSAESDIDQDAANDCCPEDAMQTGEENCNATDQIMVYADALREESVSNDMVLVQEFHTQTSLKYLLESSNYDGNDVKQQSEQVPYEEAIPKNLALVPAAEEANKSSPRNDLSYDSKVESGTITFNFDSCKLAGSTGDESPENVSERPFELQNVPIHKDIISDNLSVVNQLQRGEGESSFSMAGPMSGLITYSGPIAYSGSTSLRSDSSTTSTRSFAFPIIQSEWNSSPVRMAKAERRHFRKHRGWMHGLLCCRF